MNEKKKNVLCIKCGLHKEYNSYLICLNKDCKKNLMCNCYLEHHNNHKTLTLKKNVINTAITMEKKNFSNKLLLKIDERKRNILKEFDSFFEVISNKLRNYRGGFVKAFEELKSFAEYFLYDRKTMERKFEFFSEVMKTENQEEIKNPLKELAMMFYNNENNNLIKEKNLEEMLKLHEENIKETQANFLKKMVVIFENYNNKKNLNLVEKLINLLDSTFYNYINNLYINLIHFQS